MSDSSKAAETCQHCGALIGDRLLHEKWHRKLEEEARKVGDVIAPSGW